MPKTKMPYAEAFEIANSVITKLSPGCERIKIAGSLRRHKAEVGDIEIVAIPKLAPELDMFGQPNGKYSLLDEQIKSHNLHVLKGGERYKQIDLGSINLDLFITDKNCWGVIFTIRTGSAEFSHRLVTAKKYGGLCPGYLCFKDGRIMIGDDPQETPEEADVFRLLGLKFIDPGRRE